MCYEYLPRKMIYISDDDDGIQGKRLEEQKKINKENYVDLCSEIYKENQPLAQFIRGCLKLENSAMMYKTLKKTLLHQYYKADKSERESTYINKAIERGNNLLKTSPNFVYNHIKDLCVILKTKPAKKKVPFITLATNLNGNCSSQNKSRSGNLQINGEQVKLDVISIDSGDETDNTCNEIEEFAPALQYSYQSESENEDCPVKSKMRKVDRNLVKINSYNTSPVHSNDLNGNIVDEVTETKNNDSMEGCSQSDSFDDNKLLIPKKVVAYEPCVTNKEQKIKEIEQKIAIYKEEIEILDEQEVEDDSVNSPYIKSERLKAAIVALYKQLCQLTGEEAVKRREIRLQVIDGHPQGPTKMLETFLNDNIGPDGVPPFPDFCDVVSCVTKSNEKDNLGWSRAQIVQEASLLFTQCGTALQLRRQRRAWRELQRRGGGRAPDPAAGDPRLLARLDQNKRIAQQREKEILERYTMMQFLPASSKVSKDGSADTGTESNTSNGCNLKTDFKCSSQNLIGDNIKRVSDTNKEITSIPSVQDSDNVQGSNIDNSIITSNIQSKQSSSPNCAGNSKTYGNVSFCNTFLHGNGHGNESYHEFVAREIKQEPEDNVISQLEQFGDNLVVSVNLLEDSILTIELSSDSSDED